MTKMIEVIGDRLLNVFVPSGNASAQGCCRRFRVCSHNCPWLGIWGWNYCYFDDCTACGGSVTPAYCDGCFTGC